METAPAVTTVSSAVVRVTVYKDMFQKDWEMLVRGPVKYIISLLPALQKCPDNDCTGGCRYFHESCDEEVSAVVMDVWAWKWCTAEARKVPCAQAEMFSVYVRIPDSGLTDLLALSVWFGIFIEPRPPNQQGTHPHFSVTWLPKHHTLDSAMDLKRRNEVVTGLARFQQKLGLRTLKKHDHVIQAVIYPDREVSSRDITTVYEVGPLPHGLTSQQVSSLLRDWKWHGRPLKQQRSSADGQYWDVGTAMAPPAYVLSTVNGYVTVTLKQEKKPLTANGPRIQASTRTKKHMLAKSSTDVASSSAGPVDPWLTSDPWRRYVGVPMDTSDGTEVVFTDGASRSVDNPRKCIDKLEDRLKTHLETLVEQHVPPGLGAANMEAEDAATVALRAEVQELQEQAKTYHKWFQDVGARFSGMDNRFSGMDNRLSDQQVRLEEVQHTLVQQQAFNQTLQQEVSTMHSSFQTQLASAMEAQTSRLEALFQKRKHDEL